ncbi:MAG: hypothetical protein JSV23_05190 [Promethearchaeota archaeon]|nr:MAG: hypothetical protein JSV23_05190 [Candidatus Lokiarchaeota archaeon]
MVNLEKIEEIIQKEIGKLRNLGEHGNEGSDHLYYRSISKCETDKVKEIHQQLRWI